MEENRNDNHERENHEEKKQKEVKYVTRRTFFICYAILLVVIIQTTNSVKEDIRWTESNYSGQLSMLENQISNIPNGITYAQEQADNPFRQTEITMTAVDMKEKKATLTLTAMPKEYQAGMQVTFYLSCDGGERIAVAGVADEDRTYHAEQEVPFCDVVTATVVLQRDGVEYLQDVGSCAIKPEILPQFNGYWNSTVRTVIGKPDKATMYGNAVVEIAVPGWMHASDAYRSFRLSDVKTELYVDGKLKKTLPVEDLSHGSALHFSYEAYLEEADEITLKKGQKVEILFKATDNQGAKYTYVLERGYFDRADGYVAEAPGMDAETGEENRLTIE